VPQLGSIYGVAERLPGLLLVHIPSRKLSKLVIDERQQLLRGLGVALLDRAEDSGDFAHRRGCKEKTSTHTIIAAYECRSLIPPVPWLGEVSQERMSETVGFSAAMTTRISPWVR